MIQRAAPQNRIRSMDYGRARYADLDVDDGSVPLADAFRMSWMGGVYDATEVNRLNADTRKDGFDPLDHVPEGYESYATAFTRAQSPEAVELIRRQIDENLQTRKNREKDGGWITFGSDLVASIVDPINLIAPSFAGVGLVKGALKGGTILGGAGAAAEELRGALDPTATKEEVRAGQAFAVGFGAIFGAGFGHLGRNAVAPSAVVDKRTTVSPSMSRATLKARIRVNESKSDFDKNPNSSASGRYQFTKDTWEGLGGDWSRRFDPNEQERLMDKLTDANEAALKSAGLPITPGTLYLAHFLGSGDAVRALRNPTGMVSAKVYGPNSFAKGMSWGQLAGWADKKMGGSGAVPEGGAMPNPIVTMSTMENVIMPEILDGVDGRGLRVFQGEGRTDAEGNYTFARYDGKREAELDPLGLDENATLPPREAAAREMTMADLMEQPGPAGREMVEGDLAQPNPVREAEEIADARASVIAREGKDSKFMARIGNDPLLTEAGILGLENTTKAMRKKLASLIQKNLVSDEKLARVFFKGDLEDGAKITVKATLARLEKIALGRARQKAVAEAREPLPLKVEPTSKDADYSATDHQRWVEDQIAQGEALLDWAAQARRGEVVQKKGKQKGQPYTEDYIKDAELRAQKMIDDATDDLDNMTSSTWQDEVDFGAGEAGRLRDATNDGRAPVFTTPDEAIEEIRRLDSQKKGNDLSPAGALQAAKERLQGLKDSYALEGETMGELAGQLRRAIIEQNERHVELLESLAAKREARAPDPEGLPEQRGPAIRTEQDIKRDLDSISQGEDPDRYQALMDELSEVQYPRRTARNPVLSVFSSINTMMIRLQALGKEVPNGKEYDAKLGGELDKVIGDPKIGDDMREWAMRARELIDEDATVHFGRDRMDSPTALGEAEVETNTVFIARKTHAVTLVHEAIHLALMRRWGWNLNAMKGAEPAAGPGRELWELMIEARAARGWGKNPTAPKGGKTWNFLAQKGERDYALINFDEFMAEGLTSRQFQKWMEKGSMWDRFVDTIRSMLGMEPLWTPKLDRYLKASAELFDEAAHVKNMTDDQIDVLIDRMAEQNHPDIRPANAPETMGGARPIDPEDFDERLVIDVDGALAAFDKKPWTKFSVSDGSGLPEDAFQTPDEWLNFVVLRAREEHLAPQRMDESPQAFEHRLTERAVQEFDAGKRPMSPEASLLQRAAIAPTPQGRFFRLLKETGLAEDDPVAIEMAHFIQGMGGDMSSQLAGNAAGAAVAPGGSVMQRSLRWLKHVSDVRASIKEQWLIHRNGGVPGNMRINEVSAIKAQIADRIKGPKATSYKQFKEDVFLARVSTDPEVLARISPEAKAAAKTLDKAFNEFDKAGREVGLFDATRRMDREIRGLQDKIDRYSVLLDGVLPENIRDDLAIMVDGWKARLSKAEETRARPLSLKEEPAYFHRMWDMGAVKKDKDNFIEKLAAKYADQAEEAGLPRDMDAARERAEYAYDTITGDMGDHFHPAGRAGAAKERTIPFTNEEAQNWIVKDPELVMAVYARRMGPQIEMMRAYGDIHGSDVSDELAAKLLVKGVSEADRARIMQIAYDTKDRILGRFLKNPHSFSARAAHAAKNLANVTMLGRTIYSQVVDMARVIGTVGPDPLFRSLWSVMSGDLARMSRGPYAKEAGEALELAMARFVARQNEAGDAFMVTNTYPERLLARLQAPFFVSNLMIPWTSLLKEWASLGSGHIILKEAADLAAAIRAGGDDPKLAKRMAAHGLDRQDVMLLAQMPFEKTNSGLIVANIDAWEEMGAKGARARHLFLGAISGDVRRSVITPGVLDRPVIFDGVFHSNNAAISAEREAKRLGVIARDAYEDLRLAKEQGLEGEALEPFVQKHVEAELEWNTARNSRGQAGRIDAPLASLPFQFKTFTMAAGPKLLHGLLSDQDRAKTAGIMALMMGGMLSSWLKGQVSEEDFIKPEKWHEITWHAFDNSGLGTWFGDLGKAVESSLDLADASPFSRDDDMNSQEASGLVGPFPSMAGNLLEAFVTDGVSEDQRRNAIRRVIPFQNLVWWDETVRNISLAGSSGDVPAELSDDDGMEVSKDGFMSDLMGFSAEDMRTNMNAMKVDPIDNVDSIDLDIDALVRDHMDKKQYLKGKPPLPRRQPGEGAVPMPAP